MPDVPFWNKRSDSCVMCSNTAYFSSHPAWEYSAVARMRKLEELLGDGTACVTMNGGEPTLNPRFLDFVGRVKNRLKKGHLTLLSNGRRFRDKSFTRKFSVLAGLLFAEKWN